MGRPNASSIDDLFRQKSLVEIHGILQKTRNEVEAKKSELRELVGDHYRSVLESSDHIRAMSECASLVAQKAEKADELIATMRELAANPPAPEPAAEGTPSPEDAEFVLCERLAELLDLPEKVRDLAADFRFVEAARLALVDAPSLQAEVQQLLDASASPLPGFDVHGLVAQQAAFYRALPRQVASGCLDAFDAAELTPTGAAEAFVAHLLLDDTAQHDVLLRRFVERRSALLRHILEPPSAATGGETIEGCLACLSSAAKTFEGTVVLASSLCSSGAGGALPPLLAAALKRLADDGREMPASSYLKQKVQAVTATFQRTAGGGSATAALTKLGSAFAQTWVPQEGSEHFGGLKTMPGRFQALIASFASQSCAQLGELQRQFVKQVTVFRRSLVEPLGLGDSLDWLAVWSGACGLFCPSQGACPDAVSTLRHCVERCAAQRAAERLGELKLSLGEEQAAGTADDGDADSEDARRADEIAEMRSQCQAYVARFDEQVGETLDDVAHIAQDSDVPGAVSMAILEGLERVLSSACSALSLPAPEPLWPGGGAQVKPSSAALRAAMRAALAVETLRTMSNMDSGKASSRVGQALHAASTGEPRLAKKAETIINFLKARSEEVNCVWARLVASAGRSISSLGHFWKLADDEVGPACGWGSAAFAAKPGESAEAKAVSVPIQSSAFVFERLAAASKQVFELSGTQGSAAIAIAAAAKAALAELFAAAYEVDRPADLARLKRSGMSHLLQWLFDLSFLRIALSAAAGPGAGAYESLRDLLTKAESVAFSDPVDRLLYQDVLKASVSNHVQGTKVLLAPFFLHNPLYGYLSQSGSSTGLRSNSKPALGNENEGFELQTTFAAPLRPVLPRFPLLPVAMNVSATSDLDRLRLDPPARKAEPKAAASLMQQAGGLVGSGLGTLKFGAALFSGKPGAPGKSSEPMNV